MAARAADHAPAESAGADSTRELAPGGSRGEDLDVLVVGAGPTGLLAACELLRRDVRVRIIDQAPEPSTASKAISIYPRVLDIFEDLGVLDGIVRSSIRLSRLSYFADFRPLASFEVPIDSAARSLPQHETERMLADRLHELGGKVERGTGLLRLEDVESAAGTHGATALLTHHDGVVERVRARYVVGADGAGSTVRAQIGGDFAGTTYEMAFALIDAYVEGPLRPDEILYYQSAAGTLLIVPMPGGVYRFVSVLPTAAGDEVTVPMMQAIVDERGPDGVTIREPVWQAVFRVHARIAAAFRRGPVFLIGDAAHVHSPAGGQGMNNGLQDAHNLAWKLAAVIHGESPASLLSTYASERTAATRRIIRDTDLQTRAWMVKGRGKVLLRNALFRLLARSGWASRVYAPRLAGRRLTYAPTRKTQQPAGWSSWSSLCRLRNRRPGGLRVGTPFPRRLATGYGIAGPAAEPGEWTIVTADAARVAPWIAQVEAMAEHWPRLRVIGIPRADMAPVARCRRPGFYLIRPDGHIAAHGHVRDLPRLETELRAMLNPR
ncbi:MAG TPA: FAD-dependent monooxygenase [Streptosporangiaceae bacterium]|nr:FAD-dependent monooxygenase [Streptosporangiaceae bacterium]